MATTTNPRTFGGWLRSALQERNMSVRELARRYDPANPEQSRRTMHKYLSGGTQPSEASRQRIADALGATVEEMPATDEDEDDSLRDLLEALKPLARLLNDPRIRESVSA